MCLQCSDKPVEYICASDGKTYPNECQARRTACMTKSLLKTVRKGKCGKILLKVFFSMGFFLLNLQIFLPSIFFYK